MPNVRFSRTKSILTGSAQTASLRDQLVARTLLNAFIPVRVQLTPKTFTTSSFNYSTSSFEDNVPLLGTELFSIQQSIGFQINQRYSLGVSGSYAQASQNSDSPLLAPGPDQISYGGGLVAEGDFTDRMTGRVQFGLRDVSFEGSSESFTPPVVTVALDYQFSRDIFTTLNYTRSTFVGFQATGASGVSDIVGLTIRKNFGFRKEWAISARGSLNSQNWEESRSLPSGRSDDWFTAGMAITHQMRDWLTSSLSYSWQSFSSSLAAPGTLGLTDYDVNTIALSLRVGY